MELIDELKGELDYLMSRCCFVVAAAMIKSVCLSVDELVLGFPGVILAHPRPEVVRLPGS